MNCSTLTRATIALLLLTTAGHAQQQASDRNARRVSLQVHAAAADAQGNIPTTLILDGPPNASTLLCFRGAQGNPNPPAANDAFQLTIPGIATLSPLSFDFFNANLTLPITLPASGRLILPLPPAIPGDVVEFFHIAADGVSGVPTLRTSNSVRRTFVDPGATFNQGTQRPDAAPYFQTMEYAEIEQADVDGDGDQDTLWIGCDTTVQIVDRVDDTSAGNELFFRTVSGATAAEFADIDNDGWYDIVFSLRAPTQNSPGLALFRNLGRAPGTGNQLGAWQGFQEIQNAIIWEDIAIPRNSLDVETADVDLDGDLDVVLACSVPFLGSPNRLLLNQSSSTDAQFLFEEVTLSAFEGGLIDDTLDVEFADLDLDGDMDLVFANGLASVVPDQIYVNQGNAQGGTLGLFSPQSITAAAPIDPTCDVLVRDLNGDGLPDIYAGNNLNAAGTAIVADVLYINTTAAGSSVVTFANQTFRLPAGPGLAVTDVEFIELDGDPTTFGPVGLVIAGGDKCGGLSEPLGRGLILLESVVGPTGVTFFNNTVARGLATNTAGLSINDIETGDWQGSFQDLDVGLATDIAFPPTAPSNGIVVIPR